MSAVENNMEIQLDHQATEESRLCKATPYTELIEQLMNPCVPKTEREHAAVNEIERLVVEALGANVLHDAEKHMHEKTRKELSGQIDDLKRLWSIVAWRYRPTIGEVDRWRLTEVPPWKWGTTLAIEYEALYAKRKTEDVPTSADVIAGLEMALSQAAAMIERQQTVMQRAIEAWDCTTHQKNGDGRLWQCMEELRGECGKQPNQSHTAKERAHLGMVKELSCSLCDAPGPSEAHHIRQNSAYTCVALCTDCHRGAFAGWHGQKRAWKLRKMDELDALSVTLERLWAGK